MTKEMERTRDKVLRRQVLVVLNACQGHGRGGASGDYLKREVNSLVGHDMRFEHDAHAIALLRFLVAAGYVEATWKLSRRSGTANLSDVELAKITPKGVALVEQQLPPDPMIDDDRETPGAF